MKLYTLLTSLEYPPLSLYNLDQRSQHIEITALAYDSRLVKPGGLFIAVPGTHTDGRHYLTDAAQHGAVAALGPRIDASDLPLPYIEVDDVRIALANLACAFNGYPATQLCTIGVTGTDGKTTTCNLISALLDAAEKSNGLMTTANFKLHGKEWENTTRQSTLEALEIQQMLHRMVETDVKYAVIEATSHGLELQRVRGCAFDIGVVTNITHENLDFHGTIENYRRAKARLARAHVHQRVHLLADDGAGRIPERTGRGAVDDDCGSGSTAYLAVQWRLPAAGRSRQDDRPECRRCGGPSRRRLAVQLELQLAVGPAARHAGQP